MAETKHTPGPWEPVTQARGWGVDPADNEDSGTCVWHEIAAGEKVVAIAVDGNPGWGTATPLLDANARLIAAAPDLLAAAQRALPYLADLVARSGLEAGFGDRLAYDALEAAIAKATPTT